MKGVGVSPGISIGKAFIIRKSLAESLDSYNMDEEDKGAEIQKFDRAVQTSIEEVEAIKSDSSHSLSTEDIDILEAQIEFLRDVQIKSDIYNKINKENTTASNAVSHIFSAAVALFRNMDDEYFKARAADFEDIANRILKNLNKSTQKVALNYPENTIIIAEDISPSQAISLDASRVSGIATMYGGKTSHMAIISKAKGIPAIVACGNYLLDIVDDDPIIIDGSTGEIIIRPDAGKVEEYKEKQKKFAERQIFLKSMKKVPSQTTDGFKVKFLANISDENDMEQVSDNGAEGVGLFRTEMLFMNRNTLPTEEEQFQFYKQVALRSKNMPVTVRTLDIGGDKKLSYLNIPAETNPFLGYRAIRISLDQKDIFFSQLRAILRASIYGDLKIMFPMISSLDEVLQAKECLQKAKEELNTSGKKFNTLIETGIMIEIPAAALLIDVLAKEVDFFSIGTNDLCQYTLAVDRMNNKVSALYNHFNPGFLRLLQSIIEQTHKCNKPVAICGEMAADPLATLLLVGMGLKEFSMNSHSIPEIKNIVIKNAFSKAHEICNIVMGMNNSQSIMNYLTEVLK
jgi:phosphotransferase system enzyme I (PtsI)